MANTSAKKKDNSRTFCFVALLDDAAPFIKSWITLFSNKPKSTRDLIYKIIDVGFGAIYNNKISSLQSEILNLLPSRSQLKIENGLYQIKKNKKNKKNGNEMFKSLQFLRIRQEMYRLTSSQLIELLQSLCSITKHKYDQKYILIVPKIFKFGFETYKNEIPINIINSIINQLCKHYNISKHLVTKDRDTNNVKVYGYCRESIKITGRMVPDIIIELCYYYYYMLYIANTTQQIQNIFKYKFGAKTNEFMDYNNIEDNAADSWNKINLHKRLMIDEKTNSITTFLGRGKNDKNWYNAFGNDLIGLGQKKIWKLKITPFVGNTIVGIMEARNDKTDNHMLDGNGFCLRLWSGRFYCGRTYIKRLDGYKEIATSWQWNKKVMIRMELDMRKRGKCTLKYYVDDNEWGFAIKESNDGFNENSKYRLGVALLETQTVQLFDGYHDI